MDGLQPLTPAEDGAELYREEWSYFYSERRRLLIRLFWLAGGLAASALALVATQGGHYPPLVARIAIAISSGLLLIAGALRIFAVFSVDWPSLPSIAVG